MKEHGERMRATLPALTLFWFWLCTAEGLSQSFSSVLDQAAAGEIQCTAVIRDLLCCFMTH